MSAGGAAWLALALALSIALACGDAAGTDVSATDVSDSERELERGERLLVDGHLQQAFEAFDAAIRLDPLNATAYAQRAFTLALAHYSRALIFERRNDHNKAILEFTRAIDLAPHMIEARIGRAGVYLAIGDVDSALADLDAAADLEPRNPNLLMARAQAHILNGDAARAEADLQEVIELSDDDALTTAARQMLFAIE